MRSKAQRALALSVFDGLWICCGQAVDKLWNPVNAAQLTECVLSSRRVMGIVGAGVVRILGMRPRVPCGQDDETAIADDVQEQFQP